MEIDVSTILTPTAMGSLTSVFTDVITLVLPYAIPIFAVLLGISIIPMIFRAILNR